MALKCQRVCVQRNRHLSSLREGEIGAVVANLQRPQPAGKDGCIESLGSIQTLNELTHMPGNARLRPADMHRVLSIQVCCHKKPPFWLLVVRPTLNSPVPAWCLTRKKASPVELSCIAAGQVPSPRALGTHNCSNLRAPSSMLGYQSDTAGIISWCNLRPTNPAVLH